MRVRCDRKALLDDASLVAGVTPSRSTRPILQHVLLDATEGGLELLASDLELAIRVQHPAEACEELGSIALPGRKLLEILRESRGTTVDLSTDGPLAILRTTNGQFRLAGESPDDFPEVPTAKEAEFLEVPAGLFRDLAERTEFAASRELGRYAINGILIEVVSGKVFFTRRVTEFPSRQRRMGAGSEPFTVVAIRGLPVKLTA